MGGRAGGGAGMGSGSRSSALSSQQREFLETTMMLSPNIQYKADLVGLKGY